MGTDPPQPSSADFDCTGDPAQFPEFPGQVLDPVFLHDESGAVTGCRRVTMAERDELIARFGPPLPDAMPRGAIHVARADAAGDRMLVMWVTFACDTEAGIALRGPPESLSLEVVQRTDPPCAPGTALTSIELTFGQHVSIGDVADSITYAP
jgi:hypothetical protein